MIRIKTWNKLLMNIIKPRYHARPGCLSVVWHSRQDMRKLGEGFSLCVQHAQISSISLAWKVKSSAQHYGDQRLPNEKHLQSNTLCMFYVIVLCIQVAFN